MKKAKKFASLDLKRGDEVVNICHDGSSIYSSWAHKRGICVKCCLSYMISVPEEETPDHDRTAPCGNDV